MSEKALEENVELSSLGPVRTWIVNHDRSWAFALLYVGLAVVLSIFVSLFWLIAIVALHLLLEVLKKHYLGYRGWHRLAWTLWDVKFDLALACLALALAAYSGATLGIAGAQSAGRAGVVAGRMSWLSRGLKVVRKPLFDLWFAVRIAIIRRVDMARAARAGALLGASAMAAADSHTAEPALARPPDHLPWQMPWTRGDRFALAMIAINLAAVLIAPWITSQTYPGLLEAFATKLHPWPSG